MKTRTPFLPRIAYSAALPVSPEVAPRMFSSSPRRASSYSNRLPSSCIAMSLKASVGPLDRASRLDAVFQLLAAARSPACRTPLRCRSCGRSPSGRRPGCRRCRATGSRTPVRRTAGRATSRAWPHRPADSCSGRYRPPSGARPSSRISQKCLRSGWPRVDRYSIRQQFFLADAHDRRQHRGQAPASARSLRSSCLRARCASG